MIFLSEATNLCSLMMRQTRFQLNFKPHSRNARLAGRARRVQSSQRSISVPDIFQDILHARAGLQLAGFFRRQIGPDGPVARRLGGGVRRLGRVILPTGGAARRFGRMILPLGGAILPSGKTILPTGGVCLPIGRATRRSGRMIPPSRRTALPSLEMTFSARFCGF